MAQAERGRPDDARELVRRETSERPGVVYVLRHLALPRSRSRGPHLAGPEHGTERTRDRRQLGEVRPVDATMCRVVLLRALHDQHARCPPRGHRSRHGAGHGDPRGTTPSGLFRRDDEHRSGKHAVDELRDTTHAQAGVYG